MRKQLIVAWIVASPLRMVAAPACVAGAVASAVTAADVETGIGVFDKMIDSTPIGAAMIAVVWLFLRHIKLTEERQLAAIGSRDALIRSIADECHKHHSEMTQQVRDVIQRNNDHLARMEQRT